MGEIKEKNITLKNLQGAKILIILNFSVNESFDVFTQPSGELYWRRAGRIIQKVYVTISFSDALLPSLLPWKIVVENHQMEDFHPIYFRSANLIEDLFPYCLNSESRRYPIHSAKLGFEEIPVDGGGRRLK